MGKEETDGTRTPIEVGPSKFTRRRFSGIVGGVATLVAGAGALPLGVAGAQAVELKPVPGADNLGVNEAFKAMTFGNASGAGWTRWTVQWFNVQREPDEFNDFYFTNEKGENKIGRAHV